MLKWIGVILVAVGAVCLFLSGSGQEAIVAIVGGVLTLAGIIANAIRGSST